MAPDVPGLGYCTYWVHPIDASPEKVEELESPVIENEFLRVKVAEDGTLALTDKAIGAVYTGLNRFVDVGDRATSTITVRWNRTSLWMRRRINRSSAWWKAVR